MYDPRAGEIRGHRQLGRFVRRNQSWLAERHARIETVASTVVGSRAVVELLAHLDGDAATWAWPVAVVAESPDDQSVAPRTYCSQWPVDGQRHLRPPILGTGDAHPGDVVGRYQVALDQGDSEAIVGTFAPTGYFREPVGPHNTHRGTPELHAFFTKCFSAGGGVGLQYCAVTDDGVRCPVEYNCVRWGSHDLPSQAGIGVYERSRTVFWLLCAFMTMSKHPSITHDVLASGPTVGPQWPAIWPPSMCRISPVMNGDDSRKRMPSTMSRTWPT